MKQEFKFWQRCFKLSLLLLLAVPAVGGMSFTTEQQSERATVPAPEPGLSFSTPSSLSFAWSQVSGATGYEIWYYKYETNYSSSEVFTGNTYFTLSGLSSGTYRVYFRTVTANEKSDYVIVDDLIIL